jgi:hypothetical protein
MPIIAMMAVMNLIEGITGYVYDDARFAGVTQHPELLMGAGKRKENMKLKWPG